MLYKDLLIINGSVKKKKLATKMLQIEGSFKSGSPGSKFEEQMEFGHRVSG